MSSEFRGRSSSEEEEWADRPISAGRALFAEVAVLQGPCRLANFCTTCSLSPHLHDRPSLFSVQETNLRQSRLLAAATLLMTLSWPAAGRTAAFKLLIAAGGPAKLRADVRSVAFPLLATLLDLGAHAAARRAAARDSGA